MVDQTALTFVQEDNPRAFNALVESHQGPVDLSGAQFRGYDLRKFNFTTANLTDAYMRNADLRGLDLSQANLDGASIRDAKISGVLFPAYYDVLELRLSLEFGTRLRRKT